MADKGNKKIKYQRILLKLSGEALAGEEGFGINPIALNKIAKEIVDIVSLGIQLGVVIGAGNLFRGSILTASGIGRVAGDNIGMLATVMNALALQDTLVNSGHDCRVLSAIPMTGLVPSYERRLANEYLADGKVVIFTAGTGHPFFTTDTAACLRGIEMNAEALFKATKVDGVYSADPNIDAQAVKYDSLSYDEVLEKKLNVMDATAICMCRDNNLPIYVYSMEREKGLIDVLHGKQEGTLIGRESVKQ